MLSVRHTLPLFLLGLVASAPAPLPVAAPVPAANSVQGDYVEARTASVFAGACHYNGELVTTGHDAIMAWKITSGTWNGVDLAGVTAVGSVSSSENLGNVSADRRSEVVVDSSASPAQSAAFIDMLKSRYADQLGVIAVAHSSNLDFIKDGRAYKVSAPGFANLSVRPMPNDECCTQPSMVWYSPLIHLDHKRVGYTESAAYVAGTTGDTWERSAENSAFYGTFGS